MACFFVGQRVRIVRTTRYHQLLGAEARVTELDVIGGMIDGSRVGGCVLLDIPEPGFSGMPVASLPDGIEPVLPDGHRAGDFTNVHDLLESLSKEVA